MDHTSNQCVDAQRFDRRRRFERFVVETDGNIPRELGDFADKVQVRRFLLGLGINVNQTDVVPQTDLLAACFGLHTELEGILFSLGGNVQVRVGTERALLLELANIVQGNKGFTDHLV